MSSIILWALIMDAIKGEAAEYQHPPLLAVSDKGLSISIHYAFCGKLSEFFLYQGYFGLFSRILRENKLLLT